MRFSVQSFLWDHGRDSFTEVDVSSARPVRLPFPVESWDLQSIERLDCMLMERLFRVLLLQKPIYVHSGSCAFTSSYSIGDLTGKDQWMIKKNRARR